MKKYAEILKEASEAKLTLGEPIIGDIHDSGNKEASGVEAEDFIMYAQVAVPCEGNIPEDHRVLNVIISDYMADKKSVLETSLQKPVLSFLVREYQGVADYSEVLNGMEDFIWEDQVDYLPLVDKTSNRIFFTIELLLEMDTQEG
jgi:hypothetical protein